MAKKNSTTRKPTASRRAIQKQFDDELGAKFLGMRAALMTTILSLEGYGGVEAQKAICLRMHVLKPLGEIEEATTARRVSLSGGVQS